jgi:anti-sigma-K factor RskA
LLGAAAALLLIVGATTFLIGRSSHSNNAFAGSLEKVLSQPDARVVDLGAATDTATGHFRVAWSPTSHQAAVIADGLPSPDGGKAYELWLIDDSGAVAMRLLDPANQGSVRRVLPMTGTPQKWGVTIEPSQGSNVATGKMLFIGQA